MSSIEISTPPPLPVSARAPRTWYFLGSAVIAVLAYAALNLAHMVVIVEAVVRVGDPSMMTQAQLHALVTRGGNVALGAIVACPLVLAVLWAATRIARQ